jgi:Skp family chaperone for outer membrane proteins
MDITNQEQEECVMFNEVFESFRRATAATVQLQQEMFRTWLSLWPGVPASSSSWSEQLQQFQKKWAEAVADIVKRQQEMTKAHFKAGVDNIAKAFQVGEAKSSEELRAKSVELWQKCFDDLQKVHEAQLRGFEMVMDNWASLWATAKP